MKNLPKPNQLKIFQSIIEHGSFRAAAKALHQTQPALTKSMNELEKMLGTSLMIRGTSGVVLTDAGKLFESRVQEILKKLEHAVTEAKQFSSSSRGSIEFGSSSLPFFTMLPSAIYRFHKSFPQVSINLMEGQLSELLPALRTGKLDFVIGATLSENITNSEFIEEPFFNAPFGILARKGHPLSQSTTLRELKQAKWYLPATKVGYHNWLSKFIFPDEQQPAETIIRGNTATMAMQMVLNKDFLTIGAKEVLQMPHLGEQLCIIPTETALPDASYHFIYSRHFPLTLAARQMMEIMRWECENYAWQN